LNQKKDSMTSVNVYSNIYETQLYDHTEVTNNEVRIGTRVLDLLQRVPPKDRLRKRHHHAHVKGARSGWHVHKFGGSTFADPQCYSFVANLVDSFSGKNLIVVSAMSGITNLLYAICDRAAEGNFLDSEEWDTLRRRISGAVVEKLGQSVYAQKELQRFAADLVYLARVLSLLALASPADREAITSVVVGYGEIFSARLLTQIMREDHHRAAAFMDARDVLVVSPQGDPADAQIEVCWDVTRAKLKSWWVNRKNCDVLIVTGFIARTLNDNLPTTLKRNGSDFSATIFSALSKAQSVTVWKDVDGMYTADPKKNPDAKFIPYQTFEEAEAASERGAFVLQKDCIAPARMHNIPIYLRNCFNLSCPGTRIGPPAEPEPETFSSHSYSSGASDEDQSVLAGSLDLDCFDFRDRQPENCGSVACCHSVVNSNPFSI
jgi:aspartokinase/homoserine dehydrogenase 1